MSTVTTYTNARATLAALCDRVASTREPVIIRRRNAEDVALIAADEVLIPFDCDTFSRQALYGLMENVIELQEDHNPDLKIQRDIGLRPFFVGGYRRRLERFF